MYMARRITVTRRRNLPHWEAEEGTYFVTIRLIDSLPAFLGRLRKRALIEEALDAGYGSADLAKPAVARMVAEAIRHLHGRRYLLHSFSVMPNHVHIVFRTMPGFHSRAVLRDLKRFTAHEANAILHRDGPFWQADAYSHLIRDEKELQGANAYVLDNPAKANLRDWPWVEAFETDYYVKYEPEEE
ncbi:MAG: menaquinone-specific isochorismate synthase [Acidobacteriota bacterium]|jgi:REP element-mobilizing transposase RayT|nr:menaquinone-specific isochorismate synthase [Acidobacteriota bacterium]